MNLPCAFNWFYISQQNCDKDGCILVSIYSTHFYVDIYGTYRHWNCAHIPSNVVPFSTVNRIEHIDSRTGKNRLLDTFLEFCVDLICCQKNWPISCNVPEAKGFRIAFGNVSFNMKHCRMRQLATNAWSDCELLGQERWFVGMKTRSNYFNSSYHYGGDVNSIFTN